MISLYHDDCLEAMKHIDIGSIDAIITDPPYGTTACKWDSVIPFDLMWEQLNRIIKPNGAIVLFGSEPFSSALRMSNIKNYKYDWKWVKSRPTGHLNAKRMPLKNIEDICVFYSKQCTYNPQFTQGKPNHVVHGVRRETKATNNLYGTFENSIGKQTTDKYPKQNLTFTQRDILKSLHPTQKPVALMEYLIKTYTQENETVLDFTMGSGTTGVACKNLNRNFIGIEKDTKYFKIAEDRIGEDSIPSLKQQLIDSIYS